MNDWIVVENAKGQRIFALSKKYQKIALFLVCGWLLYNLTG